MATTLFDQLNDDNYLAWAMYMKAYLVRKELWGIVSGDIPWLAGSMHHKSVAAWEKKHSIAVAEIVSGERPVPVRLRSVSTGIDPMRRGPASLEAPSSLLSQRPKQSVGTLQGLTCEKKTESILVKAANLYSK